MKRKEKGFELMKEIFGQQSAMEVGDKINEADPSFLDFLQETFGDIYSDTTLDIKTKELIVITSLITQKNSEAQLKSHLRAALKAGVTQNEILALIKHLVLYIGFPGTINALNVAQEIFKENLN